MPRCGIDQLARGPDRPNAEDRGLLQRRRKDRGLPLLRRASDEPLRPRAREQRFRRPVRKRRQQEQPGCTHIYFTGAAGNIAAGKYNNGSPEARVQLTDRVYAGIVAAEKALRTAPIRNVSWKTQEILPPTNPARSADKLREMLANKHNVPANRIRPAMVLGWIQRVAAGTPIVLSALQMDDVVLLHLPAESFLEYQLRAQQFAAGNFVATAAYGDGGPWYIPVKEAFPQGGYEVSVANCSDAVDDILTQGIRKLLV